MIESSDDEFLDDFGAALGEADLAALLARARASRDQDLRRLVKQYVALCRTTRDLLATVDEIDDIAAVRHCEIARYARFLVGGEEPRT